jgi:phage shock protein PspC (stress-responsive transcriptional regulator)
MNRIKNFVEFKAFGVCTWLAERLGIAVSRTRLFFIYITFLTLGSPIIFYLIIGFWLNLKKYFTQAKRNPVKYL